MFDTMRKRKQLIYLFITAGMILGMGFFGMGTMMSSMHDNSAAVAVVNGQPIRASEVEERIEMQKRRIRQMLGDQAEAVLPQYMKELQGKAVEDLIDEKVSLLEAKRLKLAVPDSELIQFIASMPYYQKNGKFDADTYEKIPNRGEYEAQLREELLRNKFQQYVFERIRLTPAEIKNSYFVRETKADVQYAKINFEELGKKAPVSAEAQKAALADEASLKAYYESHQEAYIVPAQAELKQIRVGFPFQASEQQKAEAKKKIDAAFAKVNPTNFSDVAKTSSDDEYAKKGGMVGWVDVKNLEEPLRVAVNQLSPGQVSSVVETSFAYYIVKVEQKKPEVVKTFADVKNQVAEKVAQEKAKKLWAEEKRTEWDKQLAAGKSIEPELKKLGVELKKTGPFSLGQGYIPNVGTIDPLLEAIFTLTPEKPVFGKLVANDKDYYFVKLLTLEKAKETDFAKNETNFDKTLSSSLQMELAKSWMDQAKKRATIVSNTTKSAGPQ